MEAAWHSADQACLAIQLIVSSGGAGPKVEDLHPTAVAPRSRQRLCFLGNIKVQFSVGCFNGKAGMLHLSQKTPSAGFSLKTIHALECFGVLDLNI